MFVGHARHRAVRPDEDPSIGVVSKGPLRTLGRDRPSRDHLFDECFGAFAPGFLEKNALSETFKGMGCDDDRCSIDDGDSGSRCGFQQLADPQEIAADLVTRSRVAESPWYKPMEPPCRL